LRPVQQMTNTVGVGHRLSPEGMLIVRAFIARK